MQDRLTAGSPPTVFSDRDVARLLDLGACIDAVERAFRLHGEGRVAGPVVAAVHVEGGGFHIKAGVLPVDAREYFVAKTNANFPGNPSRHGLPTIQGTLVLCDARTGSPLAIMDSAEVTAVRTAAATAVAARHLARADATVAGVVGCGRQGYAQLRALALVRRLTRAAVHDVDAAAASRMADALSRELAMPITVARSAGEATRDADLCVTCTPAEAFILGPDDVRPGAFVAGVGADAEHKRELAPALLARGTIVVDLLVQCAAFGDLHHAIAAGAVTVADVHAELGQVVAGRRPGRTGDDEITIFDSTGMALQDAAAAVTVWQQGGGPAVADAVGETRFGRGD